MSQRCEWKESTKRLQALDEKDFRDKGGKLNNNNKRNQ